MVDAEEQYRQETAKCQREIDAATDGTMALVRIQSGEAFQAMGEMPSDVMARAPIAPAKLTIHGDGGHGAAVKSCAASVGYLIYTTDRKYGTEPGEGLVHIAIGDNRTRKEYDTGNLVTLVHPTAFIEKTARFGDGVFVGPMAVVHVGVRVGRGAIVNTGATVEHGCVVGDWAHVATGATLCGHVTVGEGAFVGAGAVVKQDVSICPWAVVGCGTVVVKDITEPGVYVGNPARSL